MNFVWKAFSVICLGFYAVCVALILGALFTGNFGHLGGYFITIAIGSYVDWFFSYYISRNLYGESVLPEMIDLDKEGCLSFLITFLITIVLAPVNLVIFTVIHVKVLMGRYDE